MKIPTLIAHRGYAARYPENTLAGIEAALEAGACVIEIDIQITADKIPVLLHDTSLERVTGKSGNIHQLRFDELGHYSVCEPDRPGLLATDSHIPSLAELVSLLEKWPQARIMIELKKECLDSLDCETLITRVLEICEPLGKRAIIISYITKILDEVRSQSTLAIGWVLTLHNPDAHTTANTLRPDYIICNHNKINSADDLWPGSWQWALYEIIDADLALTWANRGAAFIETMAIADLLEKAPLSQGRCHA